MPVRNFWIECNIDGRSTILAGGPRSKNGGFSLTVKMRDSGGIIQPLDVWGYERDGELVLNCKIDGKPIKVATTKR